MSPLSLDADVIIVGGGPCGLMLANELGRRHVATLLFNDRHDTSPHPQANATQARTMEHYRRLGFAHRVRAAGLPRDYRPDVAYFTRLTAYEVARLDQPASGDTDRLARSLSGSWSAAELPHRCSQMYIERILRDEASKLRSVDLRFGTRVISFTDHGSHVELVTVTNEGTVANYTARYLAGADGPRSQIRAALGIKYHGDRDRERPFLVGSMYSIYFRSEALYKIIPHRPAWQYWVVNPERRGLMLALDGDSSFVFMAQLQPHEDPDQLTEADARRFLHRAVGGEFELDIIARSEWAAGLALVADAFQAGRVFLGGDAVHLFTPTGGLGYNTAVEDAVNLGWKVAAVVNGWGGGELVSSYETERKPIARRNIGFARMFAESVGGFEVPPQIEEDSAEGKSARFAVGEYLSAHARAEFDIPGITLGGRYDGSPLIAADGTRPPDDGANVYQPSACPGGRAPHAWLSDGRSLYDALGFEFTLLRLTQAPDVEPILDAAAQRGVPITLLDACAEGLRDLYGADLALIRPDQIVSWRGERLPDDVNALLDQVTGHGTRS